MEQNKWDELLENPKIITGCLVIVSNFLFALALGYYLGWGMTLLSLGVFLFWLAYRVNKHYDKSS